MADEQEVQSTAGANESVQNPQGTTDVSVSSDTNNSTDSTKKVVGTEQDGQNWQTKHALLEKNYNELRKKLNEQGFERNEYRKRFEDLTNQQKQILEALSKATEKPYDPDQFMEELKTQGPNYFKKLAEEQFKTEKEQLNSQVTELKGQLEGVLIERAIEARKSDKEKYPNFADLESEMSEIFNSNSAFYQQLKLDERIDALYNQAVLRHSQEALQVAGQLGKKKAEEELANEAKSGVAGGGKVAGSTTVDPTKMSATDLRKFFVSQIGEAID